MLPGRALAQPCDAPLLIFVHVAKTGGTTLERSLPAQLNTSSCYPTHTRAASPPVRAAPRLVQNYACGACGFASAEWNYTELAGHGALNHPVLARAADHVCAPSVDVVPFQGRARFTIRFRSLQEVSRDFVLGSKPNTCTWSSEAIICVCTGFVVRIL